MQYTRLRRTIVPLTPCMPQTFTRLGRDPVDQLQLRRPSSPMSTRRASASGGHVGITSPNTSTTRIHRPGDSLHGFPTNIPPNAPYNANSTPQQKVVHTLVNRLKNKASRKPNNIIYPFMFIPCSSYPYILASTSVKSRQTMLCSRPSKPSSISLMNQLISSPGRLLNYSTSLPKCVAAIFCSQGSDLNQFFRHRKRKPSEIQNCYSLS